MGYVYGEQIYYKGGGGGMSKPVEGPDAHCFGVWRLYRENWVRRHEVCGTFVLLVYVKVYIP